MSDQGQGRRPLDNPDDLARAERIPGRQQMGVHPEQETGLRSVETGGVASRGLGGLKPQKLFGDETETVGQLIEYPIDGSQVLVGVFDQAGAERAINALQAAGYDPNEVNVLASTAEEAERIAETTTPANDTAGAEPEAERLQGQEEVGRATKVNLGTGLGLLTGAAAGATAGLAALAMPGIGDLLRSGGGLPAALAGGAVVGAGVGAWGGTALGYGVPQEDTGQYARDRAGGHWLVAVRTNQVDQTLALLREAGAINFQDDHGGGH